MLTYTALDPFGKLKLQNSYDNRITVIYNNRIFPLSDDSTPVHPLDFDLFITLENKKLTSKLTAIVPSDMLSENVAENTIFYSYLSSFCGCYGSLHSGSALASAKRYNIREVLEQVSNTYF